ncbi:MAG: GIY-YIG nuclease family protein [Bacteroidales bacterium]|nr:GIY-YIG nuclease family protein [Bacteroidales bacterium]
MKINESILNNVSDYYGIIYMYENLINHKKYIGQTTKPILERHKNHKSQKYNSYFHNALSKYGEECFEITILDYGFDADELNAKEQYWINFYETLKSGYNLTAGGKGSSGYKHSKETIQYLKEINSGSNNPMFGRIRSPQQRINMSRSKIGTFKDRKLSTETKLKISKSKIGKSSGANNPMFGKHHSQETKDKIRNNRRSFAGANHPQSKIYVQLNLDGTFIAEYQSGLDASLATGCDRSDISKCCNKKIKQSKSFVWMYKEDYLMLNKI